MLLWLTLIVALWIIQLTGPDELREALKLLPDLGHLLQRLAADAAVPQRVRIGLAVLIGYMLLPIDLVPDFIPVLGYTEDVVIAALALRWVVRCAETNLLSQHWRGTPERRTAYAQFSGLPRGNLVSGLIWR